MSIVGDILTVTLAVAGCGFFCVGTVGLLRFPDLHSRLHALTKADTVGLGLIILALMPQAGSAAVVGKLLLIWALALVAAATTAHVLALPDDPQRSREPEPGP